MGSKRRRKADPYARDPIQHIDHRRLDRDMPIDDDEEVWSSNPALPASSRKVLENAFAGEAEWLPRMIRQDNSESIEVLERADDLDLKTHGRSDAGWLWPSRIPYGGLTVITGPAGSGKSQLVHDLIARVSRGTAWPEFPGEVRRRAEVLWAGSEFQSPQRVIEGVERAGGDLTRVRVVNRVAVRLPSGTQITRPLTLPDDVHHLEWVRCRRVDVRLLVIDPLGCFFPGGSLRSQIFTLLALRRLAARTNTAVVCVVQWRIPTGWQSLDRVMSLHPLAEVADVIWYVARHLPRKPERLLAVVKSPAQFTLGSGTRMLLQDGKIQYDQHRPVIYAESPRPRRTGDRVPPTSHRLEECLRLIAELTEGKSPTKKELIARLTERRQCKATIYRALQVLRQRGEFPVILVPDALELSPPPDPAAHPISAIPDDPPKGSASAPPNVADTHAGERNGPEPDHRRGA